MISPMRAWIDGKSDYPMCGALLGVVFLNFYITGLFHELNPFRNGFLECRSIFANFEISRSANFEQIAPFFAVEQNQRFWKTVWLANWQIVSLSFLPHLLCFAFTNKIWICSEIWKNVLNQTYSPIRSFEATMSTNYFHDVTIFINESRIHERID